METQSLKNKSIKKTRLLFVVFTLLVFASVNAQRSFSNTIKIKGVVTNAKGLPMKKADIFVDSLKTGIRTNKKGEYKLRIPTTTNSISVFSEDEGIQSESYDGQKEVSFSFPKSSVKKTKEELIKLGYIFDMDVFRNLGKKSYSQYTDIFQIIREKFSGVRVEGSSIYVRGVISLNGNQNPLFVVDGNYVNSIAFINPDELASIELLKGEDAALYGSRGAPGVFIISLKK